MKNILIVVDMQKDFVDGALGTKEAVIMRKNACERIRCFEGEIIVTYDTHTEDYLETAEGKKLPVVHCVKGTDGWHLDSKVAEALTGKRYTEVCKPTFGSVELPKIVSELAAGDDFVITLIGLCTDICVVSNALLLKANFPEKVIRVDSACCAGVTPESHDASLLTMKMCQIDIV